MGDSGFSAGTLMPGLLFLYYYYYYFSDKLKQSKIFGLKLLCWTLYPSSSQRRPALR